MSDFNGSPWMDPQRDARERSMWDKFDDFTTRRAWAEQEAVRERDANLGDEQRRLIAELNVWWQDELEGKYDGNTSHVYEPGSTRS